MEGLTVPALVVGAVGLLMLAAGKVLAARRRAAGLPPEAPEADIRAEVAALLAQGRRTDAVRTYRRRTGAELAEATRAVDTMADREGS